MLPLTCLDGLEALFLRLPEIVNIFDRRDRAFSGAVKAWLQEAERLLAKHGQATAGEIARLRTLVIAAEEGLFPTDLSLARRSTPRRVRGVVAADALRKAAGILSDIVHQSAIQVGQARELAAQLAFHAVRKGLGGLPSPPRTGASLLAIWTEVRRDGELAAMAAQLVSLAGTSSALLLFAQALAADTPSLSEAEAALAP